MSIAGRAIVALAVASAVTAATTTTCLAGPARFELSGYVEPYGTGVPGETLFLFRTGPGGEATTIASDPVGFLRSDATGWQRCTAEPAQAPIDLGLPYVVVTGSLPSELMAPRSFGAGSAPGLWSESGTAARTTGGGGPDTDGDGVPDSEDDDDDGDGIPDPYEAEHGLDPLAAGDATADRDGDGKSNRDEFLAGTSASDAASRFEGSAARAPGTDMLRLGWFALPGRQYSVIGFSELGGAPAVVLEGFSVDSGRPASVDVPMASAAGFFVIRVELPPAP